MVDDDIDMTWAYRKKADFFQETSQENVKAEYKLNSNFCKLN